MHVHTCSGDHRDGLLLLGGHVLSELSNRHIIHLRDETKGTFMSAQEAPLLYFLSSLDEFCMLCLIYNGYVMS